MNKRSQTTVVLAMSADGKIADRSRQAARFGSAIDQAHLESQVAQADGVLFGTGMLQAYGTTMPVRQPELLAQRRLARKPDQPVQILCSRRGQFQSEWRFFQQAIPRWLLVAEGAEVDESLPFDRIFRYSEAIVWPEILKQLAELGLTKIVVLGGAELVGTLLEANCLDYLWLTVCPVLIGGRDAPTPIDGKGLSYLQMPQLELLESQIIGSEIFLHYQVKGN